MSSSWRYRIVDVRGDGSCFFRSLYVVARHKRITVRILKAMEVAPDVVKLARKDEDAFVVAVRAALARIIRGPPADSPLITEIYDTMKTLNASNYRAITRTTFPGWFTREFVKIPRSESEFRERYAAGIEKISSWAGEIEYRLLSELLYKRLKIRLVVFNSPPKSTRLFKKNCLYLLNRGEAHYNAIIIEWAEKEAKKPIDKTKVCRANQILNPATKRCVLRESCTGYKVLVKELGL